VSSASEENEQKVDVSDDDDSIEEHKSYNKQSYSNEEDLSVFREIMNATAGVQNQ